MSPARGVAVLVSYYAPPAIGIAAQRLVGFARHLPDFGWDPVVVAPEDPHFHASVSGAHDLPEGVRVVRTRNPEPSRWFRRLAGGGPREEPTDGVRPLEPVSGGGVLRALARDWLYVPDAQLLWIPWAAAATERVARAARPRPVVVVSSSVPYSAHFAARRAARRAGVPWVAEYRDPWSAAPAQLGRRPALRQAIDARLDHGLVEAADAVVVTSDATAELYRKTFSERAASRVAVVRNGFEPVGGDGAPPAAGRPLRLLYSGTLLHASYAGPLLEALDRLWESEPGRVELHVFGPRGRWERAGRADAPYVRLHGLVPAEEMPRHLSEASALVLLQPEPAHAQYVAGKLYEYLGARRPVLAAIPPGGEAERLITDHGDPRLVRPQVADAFESALSRLLAEHRAGTLQAPRVAGERVASLTRRAQTRALAAVLDSVAEAR